MARYVNPTDFILVLGYLFKGFLSMRQQVVIRYRCLFCSKEEDIIGIAEDIFKK